MTRFLCSVAGDTIVVGTADAPGVSSSGIQLQTSVQAMGEASAVAAGAYEEGEMNLWRERGIIGA